jgi:hypothetical protein
MKSTVNLLVLFTINIALPSAVLFIDYGFAITPIPVWTSFAVLGIITSVINNKLTPT